MLMCPLCWLTSTWLLLNVFWVVLSISFMFPVRRSLIQRWVPVNLNHPSWCSQPPAPPRLSPDPREGGVACCIYGAVGTLAHSPALCSSLRSNKETAEVDCWGWAPPWVQRQGPVWIALIVLTVWSECSERQCSEGQTFGHWMNCSSP